MKMPECYSDMNDCEKGLTGGLSTKEKLISAGSMTTAVGGITIALGAKNWYPIEMRGKALVGVGVALTVAGLATTITGICLDDN